MISDCSDQTKSALISDLMFLRALLIIAIWKLKSSMNFVLLLLFIGIITCLQNSSFIVIWSLGFTLSPLLIIFWILLIFLVSRSGKVSFIFKTFLVELVGVEIWAYVWLSSFSW